MKIGGLIVAAGMSSRMNDFKPMMKIGSISTIQRVISTMQQAGVKTVVVVTGFQAEMLEKHIAKMNVICLKNEAYEHTEMFESVKIGMNYLQDKCDKILFTPADIPLFTVETVRLLMNCSALLAKPVCQGKGGHPLLIDASLLPGLITYNGTGGLKGAVTGCGCPITRVDVGDEGILFDADTQEDFKRLLDHHNSQMLRPKLKLTLAKEQEFFDQRTALLVSLIGESGSVRTACEKMKVSYRKGWEMLNRLEEQLGFPIIIRHPGGISGGYSELTEAGSLFLRKYYELQERAEQAVRVLFDEIYGNY